MRETMPKRLSNLVLLAILSGATLRAEQPKTPTDASPEEITAWVEELGNEDFSVRTAAEEKLRKSGSAARADLEKAQKNEDAEIRTRAQKLLGPIITGPYFDKMRDALAAAKALECKVAMTAKYSGAALDYKGTLKAPASAKTWTMDLLYAAGGQEMPTKYVCDGTHVFQETTYNAGGDKKQTQVVKYGAGSYEKISTWMPQYIPCPLHVFRNVRERFDFRTVTEAKLDGEDVVVLEGRVQPDAEAAMLAAATEVGGAWLANQVRAGGGAIAQARVYLAKADNMPRKLAILSGNGDEIQTVLLSEIKTGVTLDASAFRYEPPKGVHVHDMEQTFQQQRGR